MLVHERPIPLAAPVTTATRSLRRFIRFSLGRCSRARRASVERREVRGATFSPVYAVVRGFDQGPGDAGTSNGTVTRILSMPDLFETHYVRLAPSNTNNSSTNNVTLSNNLSSNSTVTAFNTRVQGSDRGAFLNWFLSSDFNKDRIDIFKEGDTPEINFSQGLVSFLSSMFTSDGRGNSSDDSSPLEDLLNNGPAFQTLRTSK